MSEPILDVKYWRERIKDAPPDEPWKAIWNTGEEEWFRVAEEHKKIISECVGERDNVLDIGCGNGRLVGLLPKEWRGRYTGLDLSPDFIRQARMMHSSRDFSVWNAVKDPIPLTPSGGLWDVAVLIGFESMIKKHLGPEHWPPIEGKIRGVSKYVLVLDFTRGWKFYERRRPAEFDGNYKDEFVVQ